MTDDLERLVATDDVEALRAAARRLVDLQALTAALAGATRDAEVLDVIAERALPLLGVASGLVVVFDESGRELAVARAAGYPAPFADASSELAPIAAAIARRETVFVERRDDLVARFPAAAASAPPDRGAWVALPLCAEERCLGGIVGSFVGPRRFDAGERMFARVLADVCAQSLARSRRFEVEHREAVSRRELLSIVSHDLRNPLGSILTGAGLLRKLAVGAELAPKLERYTAIVTRAAERMNRWLGDLLELATLDARQATIGRDAVDLGALVREAVEQLMPQATEKRLIVEAKVPEDPPRIACDRERIMRVLSNLLGNALKFTPEGGRIEVAVEPRSDAVVIAVRDSGPGIPEEQLAKIFDPYWQARRELGRGVGLGLSIARGLVEAHGGRIWAESQAGAGATFSFTLPCVPDG